MRGEGVGSVAKKVTVDDKMVLCPLYNGRRVNSISCQGFCHPDSYIVQVFNRKEDIYIHMNTFCKASYRKCELYRAIMEARFLGELDD